MQVTTFIKNYFGLDGQHWTLNEEPEGIDR